MNAAEHYAQAERLLAAAVLDVNAGQFEGNRREHDEQVARAQVHATLASIPSDRIDVYEWTQARLLERLTEQRCLDAFRTAWEQADAEDDKGNRVRRGMAAAIKAALL